MIVDRYHSGFERCKCPLGPMFPRRMRRAAAHRVRIKRAIRRLLISRGIPVPDPHVMDWLIQYVEGGR